MVTLLTDILGIMMPKPERCNWSILKHIKKLVILVVVPFGAAVQKADRRFDYGMEICKRT